MTLYLRHRKTSGIVYNRWEFIPESRSILAVFEGNPLPIKTWIPICTEANPREFAFYISRRTDGWQLAPAYAKVENRTWVSSTSAYHQLVPMEFVILIGAPEHLDEEMVKILETPLVQDST